ncbi:phosphoadenylyl-sulfate reductase [Algicella marina]|nr:phosphoadenylyl-sulfate reductase [Algicella marina]
MLLDPSIRFQPDLAVEALNARYEGAPPQDVLHAALRFYAGGIAVVSSFGAESAVLLHMVSEINPHTPVLLIDTEMLFPQTIAYQEELTAWLGLTDVRRIRQDRAELKQRDPYGALHLSNPDACCTMRKVEPLERALQHFTASISGRKRFQAGTRVAMPLFEQERGGRIKVNPLAEWSPKEIAAYMVAHDLPRHPLVAEGYPSIGCMPCTSKVGEGEDARAGRWRGQDKIECGIHFTPEGARRAS